MLSISKRTLFILTSLAPLATAAPTLQIEATGTPELTLRGKDYEWDGPSATLSNMKHPMRGCGPFVHDDAEDRPPGIFDAKVTLHFGPDRAASVLLPVIPPA